MQELLFKTKDESVHLYDGKLIVKSLVIKPSDELCEFISNWIKTNQFTGELIDKTNKTIEVYEGGKIVEVKFY